MKPLRKNVKKQYEIMYYMTEEDRISDRLVDLVFRTYVTPDYEVKVRGLDGYDDTFELIGILQEEYNKQEREIWLELVFEALDRTNWGYWI